jgi:cyanophycinase
MIHRRAWMTACTILLCACASAGPPTVANAPQDRNGLEEATPAVGPARGALLIAGGGALDADVMGRFIELAGGRNARIVVLPTAGTDDDFPEDWPGYRVFRDAGVRSVTVLHTRDRAVADTEQFIRPLRNATGVWIAGGRQWRLVDSYLGTRTVDALHAVLERDGVIGGTSAGASIQAGYMVRGAVEGNTIMMAPGYEQGFDFLRGTAIDQHLLARGREDDMLQVIERHPDLLGIGLDEGTAIVVTGDRAEVVGRGGVAFYNAVDRGPLPYYFLRTGDVFDLAGRRTLDGAHVPPRFARDRFDAVRVMDRLFAAMRVRDTAAIRSLAHPQLRIFVPGEQNAAPTLRVSSLDEFIRSIGAATARLDEVAIDPDVRIDGNLATIWTYYDFRRDGQFSHCGHDAFQLARTATGWQIVGLAYTIRTADCRTRQP